MCSPPTDADSLRETGSVARYTPRGLYSCDAMCCISALADGAEGLHFSAFLVISGPASSYIALTSVSLLDWRALCKSRGKCNRPSPNIICTTQLVCK